MCYFRADIQYFHLFQTLVILLQIKPLVGPTKAIMSVKITNFQWHEFFPRGKKIEYVRHVFIMFRSAIKVFSHVIIEFQQRTILVLLLLSGLQSYL